MIVGEILPSACERNKFSKIGTASRLLPNAEYEKRNHCESDSY